MGSSEQVRRGRRIAITVLAAFVLLTLVAGTGGKRAAAATASPIVPRGGTTSATWSSDSTRSLVVTAPAGAVVGDVLIASLSVGRSNTRTLPTLSAPAGWVVVGRTDIGSLHSTV